MRPPEDRINLTTPETNQLWPFRRQSTAPPNLVKRAKIIRIANGEGQSHRELSERLGTTSAKVPTWTKRWIDRALDSIEERLSDLARPGSPGQITPKRWCQILAVCCTPPQESGYPRTHWTGHELATEVVKPGIVERISVSPLNDGVKKPNDNRLAPALGGMPRKMNVKTKELLTLARFPGPCRTWRRKSRSALMK